MAAASAATCPVTVMLVLVTTPRWWASMMPRFTPRDAPKSSALKMRYRVKSPTRLARGVSGQTRPLEQRGDHRLGLEILVSELDGRPGVSLVVARYRVECRDHVLQRREGEEALSGRQDVADTGVRGYHGAPGGG